MAQHRGSNRMTKQWTSLGGIVNSSFNSASTNVAAAILNFTEAQTVLRMIGEYVIGPDATSAPVVGDTATLGVAIGVFSTDAASITAVPDPLAEPEYPWLYWKAHTLNFETTSVDPSTAQSSVRQSFDIRSMRKVKPRESLAMVIEYQSGGGDPTLLFSPSFTRVLVAVH